MNTSVKNAEEAKKLSISSMKEQQEQKKERLKVELERQKKSKAALINWLKETKKEAKELVTETMPEIMKEIKHKAFCGKRSFSLEIGPFILPEEKLLDFYFSLFKSSFPFGRDFPGDFCPFDTFKAKHYQIKLKKLGFQTKLVYKNEGHSEFNYYVEISW